MKHETERPGSPPHNVITTLRVYFYIPTNVIARRAMPDVATLQLSREQNQARLNYAEAEQGRPKVNLSPLIVIARRALPDVAISN